MNWILIVLLIIILILISVLAMINVSQNKEIKKIYDRFDFIIDDLKKSQMDNVEIRKSLQNSMEQHAENLNTTTNYLRSKIENLELEKENLTNTINNLRKKLTSANDETKKFKAILNRKVGKISKDESSSSLEDFSEFDA